MVSETDDIWDQSITGLCSKQCKHGGVCPLEPGHDGLHVAGPCEFSDTEAIDPEIGNARYRANSSDWERLETVMRALLEMDG